MFGSEPVTHGGHDDSGVRGQRATRLLGNVEAARNPPAAVDVHHNRQGRIGLRNVQTHGLVAIRSGVDRVDDTSKIRFRRLQSAEGFDDLTDFSDTHLLERLQSLLVQRVYQLLDYRIECHGDLLDVIGGLGQSPIRWSHTTRRSERTSVRKQHNCPSVPVLVDVCCTIGHTEGPSLFYRHPSDPQTARISPSPFDDAPGTARDPPENGFTLEVLSRNGFPVRPRAAGKDVRSPHVMARTHQRL